jgi:hypothetical protein
MDYDNSSVISDLEGYSLKAYEDKKELYPLGIAKDGHIIWGPYNAEGELWEDCDVDVCNGAIVDGVYGYPSTRFFPYIVGCFGPGNNSTFSA